MFALALLSGVAAVWRPAGAGAEKILMSWVSDSQASRGDQISIFNQEHPSLAVSLDYGNTGQDKIMLQCISGVGPDLFDIYDQAQLQAYVEAGVLLDVSADADRMGFSAHADSWANAYNLMSYEHRQYAYPANVGANILVFNKNVFDAFGVEYPTGLMTWDEFVALAKKVSSKNADSSMPRDVFAVRGLNWKTIFESMRGEFFAENGELQIGNSEELLKAFQMHRDFLFVDRLMPNSVEAASMSGRGGWGGAVFSNFASGKFAMIVTGHFAIPFLERAREMQVIEAKSGTRELSERPLRLGCVLLPHFAGQPASYRLQARVTGINAKSRNKKEALEFLQFLSSPSYSLVVNQYTDSLPGNPKYASLGLEEKSDEIPRVLMHQTTREAVTHGYVPRVSPYILTSDVIRILDTQVARMENDSNLDPRDLLIEAQAELDKMLSRNLSRNPELKKRFEMR